MNRRAITLELGPLTATLLDAYLDLHLCVHLLVRLIRYEPPNIWMRLIEVLYRHRQYGFRARRALSSRCRR